MIRDPKSHYDKLSKTYDDLWFYSDEFVHFMTDFLIDHLELNHTSHLLDLGCGTGIYAKGILEKVSFDKPIFCVDLSSEMLKGLEKNPEMTAVAMDSISFCEKYPNSFDRIFSKEMLHHIKKEKRPHFYKMLFDALKKDGITSILQMPPTMDYPLFDDAVKYFEKHQIQFKDVEKGMLDAGFSDVTVKFIHFPLAIPKSKYLEMVRNRYMSLLSEFSDAEINRGITEIERKYSGIETLEFQDKFVVITGKRETSH